MASVEAPPAAGDGSVDLQLQALAAQEMPQSTMDAVMAGQAAPSAPGSAAEDGDHATDNSSPASSTKVGNVESLLPRTAEAWGVVERGL